MVAGDLKQFGKKYGAIAGGAFIALLAASGFLMSAASDQWQIGYEENRDIRAIELSHSSRVEQVCPANDPERAICITQAERDARLEQRNVRDLAAQESMALWTRVMGVMAVFGIGISTLGVVLIFQTLRESQRAANAAMASQRAYIENERAVLVLAKHCEISVHDFVNDAHLVKLTVANQGKASAKITRVCMDATTKPAVPDSLSVNIPRLIRVGRDGATIQFSTTCKIVECIGGNLGNCYLVGFIEYETLERSRLRTYFMYGFEGMDLAGTENFSSKKLPDEYTPLSD